jgi:hypothetical protein
MFKAVLTSSILRYRLNVSFWKAMGTQFMTIRMTMRIPIVRAKESKPVVLFIVLMVSPLFQTIK